MKELMYLPLNPLETSTLIQFLSESEDASAKEALVIYHLLHCNFFEAERVNDKLSLSLMKKLSPSDILIKERSSDRNNLVECLLSGISKTEKSLVNEINRLPIKMTKIEESLKPLSVSVKSSALKKTSYSDFLRSLFTKTPISTSYSQALNKSRGRSYLDDLPFLRPINTPERIKPPSSTRNNNSVVNKRALFSTSPNEYSSPAKRSRLLDNAVFKETSNSKRKLPKHLAGDIVSLLQTPPIHRRISLSKSQDYLGTPSAKPQSILKKSISSAVQETNDDLHRAETPPIVSEVLEALSKSNTTEKTLPSFMFSPPLTRGRLRRKKLDETMGSSSSSVTSEVSFATEKKPPMDPILEGIIQEKSLLTKRSNKKRIVKVSTNKRVPKKAKLQDSIMDITDQSFLSSSQTPSMSQKKAPASPRHSMTLRQTKSKQMPSSFL